MIKKSDKLVAENFYCSLQVYRDQAYRVDRKQYFETCASGIRGMVDHIRKHLDLPAKINVRVARLGRTNATGMYFWRCNTVVLDELLLEKDDLCVVLAHEMIHAEQYYTGRLAVSEDDNIFYWNDGAGAVPIHNWACRDYHEYRDLPWEKDAYDRQGPIAEELCRMFFA